jgi:hypothetical protein
MVLCNACAGSVSPADTVNVPVESPPMTGSFVCVQGLPSLKSATTIVSGVAEGELSSSSSLPQSFWMKMPAPVPNPMKKPNKSMHSSEQYFWRICRFRQ